MKVEITEEREVRYARTYTVKKGAVLMTVTFRSNTSHENETRSNAIFIERPFINCLVLGQGEYSGKILEIICFDYSENKLSYDVNSIYVLPTLVTPLELYATLNDLKEVVDKMQSLITEFKEGKE